MSRDFGQSLANYGFSRTFRVGWFACLVGLEPYRLARFLFGYEVSRCPPEPLSGEVLCFVYEALLLALGLALLQLILYTFIHWYITPRSSIVIKVLILPGVLAWPEGPLIYWFFNYYNDGVFWRT